MRKYSEPTMKNLLRMPMVMAVPFSGLLALSFLVLLAMILTSGSKIGNTVTLVLGLVGYAGLFVCSKFMIAGWEDELFYPLEKRLAKKMAELSKISRVGVEAAVLSPDTLDPSDLLFEKQKVAELLSAVKSKENLLLEINVKDDGALIHGVTVTNGCLPEELLKKRVFSLVSLPVTTDPLYLSGLINRLEKPFQIFLRVTGMDFVQSKRRIEGSRKRNSRSDRGLSNIDSEVTFDEASRVLEAMSKGEETLCEFSLLIVSDVDQPNMDSQVFKREKNIELALRSILALRRKHFRGHSVRLITASDLIPNLIDPKESSAHLLQTVRGNPLYFSPQDSRLDSLHWLVVGATGTGKSFFTGAILKRLIEQGTHMSVLFIDHNRSFRRLVKSHDGVYLEPSELMDCEIGLNGVFTDISRSGGMAGIELSDLTNDDKKAAAKLILSRLEGFLRERNTLHPIYLVLDECWNFIRDEPVLVQRAFREFRKLNGAVIAITQSLSDFLSDPSGKSIIQNTPIRILLRQGEDVSQYRGTLGLNEVEMNRLRLLKQKKGVFSECLIKTSFLSRLGRLYPTSSEYELLRTDNIREEIIRENLTKATQL